MGSVLLLAKPLYPVSFDPHQKLGRREKALGMELEDQGSSLAKCHLSFIQSFNKHI